MWRLKNKEKCVLYKAKYCAKKAELPSTLTYDQWNIVKRYFGNKCAYCGKEVPLQQDHFVPLSKGGEYTHNNIIPACRSCNTSKHAQNFFDWYPRQKFYSKKREQRILKFLGYKGKIQQLSVEV